MASKSGMPERTVAMVPGKAAVHELVAQTAGSDVVPGLPVRLRHPSPERRKQRPVPSARQRYASEKRGSADSRADSSVKLLRAASEDAPSTEPQGFEKGRRIAANLGFVPRERDDPRDRGPERFGARSPVRCQRIPVNGFGREGGSSRHLETVTRASAQAPRCLCFDAKATTKVGTIAPCRLAATDVCFGERTEHETQPARPTSRRDPSPDGSTRRCRRNSRRDPHATVRLLDVVVQPGFGGAPYGVRRGAGNSFGSGFTRSGQGQRVLAFAAPRKATRPARKPASRVGSPMRSRFVGHGRTRASARVKTVLRHRGHKRRGRLSRHASRS
jgi:hypothetical protein